MIKIKYLNDKLIGYAVLDIDGFYYFEDIEKGGLWGSDVLRYVANKLDELNVPYREHLDTYFKNSNEQI